MGCSQSSAVSNGEEDWFDRTDLKAVAEKATNKVVKTGPHNRPLLALAEVLVEYDKAENAKKPISFAALQESVIAALGGIVGKEASPLGVSLTDYVHHTVALSDEKVAAAKAGLDAKKKVLMVIDVQDGYDGGFIASLPDDAPGGLAFLTSEHPVRASYELHSKKQIATFARGDKMISFDKVWNRGLDGKGMERVSARVVKEIESGGYDLIVFTYDYLEKSNGEEKGVFALDATPWSDPKKPIALVPYGSYLTINAGGLGTNVSERIRKKLPEVTNARGPEGKVKGQRTMYFRKQVDDAFDDRREKTERTLGEEWLDDVDVDDNGLPQPGAKTLLQKLTDAGFGPDEALLSFCGVVTNRCVASSLLHAVNHGFETKLLEGGCAAASDKEHVDGVAMIREKGAGAVEVVE